VWLLTEACLSVVTVDEHGTLLDITVLLKKIPLPLNVLKSFPAPRTLLFKSRTPDPIGL
jgi:hypothetical protein